MEYLFRQPDVWGLLVSLKQEIHTVLSWSSSISDRQYTEPAVYCNFWGFYHLFHELTPKHAHTHTDTYILMSALHLKWVANLIQKGLFENTGFLDKIAVAGLKNKGE